MIGRVTSVGMTDYSACFDDKKKLHLFEQNKLVGEREIEDVTGAVFEGDVIYYTRSHDNTIHVETVSGNTVNNHSIEGYDEIIIYKKLSNDEFVLQLNNKYGVKTVVYNTAKSEIVIDLPCESFHDFVYDDFGFRLSGHHRTNISVYKDDCDSEDILYGEYNRNASGEISEKCHYGIAEIENGDRFIIYPNSKNINFSPFDSFSDYFIYPYILTSENIVAVCNNLNGFIVFEKTSGALKYLISLPKDIYERFTMFGFNEKTNIITMWDKEKLYRFKIEQINHKFIEEIHPQYMLAYEINTSGNLIKNIELEKYFCKAIDLSWEGCVND